MFSRSVDVLVVDLATVEVDEDLLSVSELGTALGITSPARLRDYLAARTWLRQRLGEYLDRPAAEIEFAADDVGKPQIVAPHTDLSYSFSYSGGIAVLAGGFRVAGGADIEALEGAGVDPEAVNRFLSQGEANAVLAASDTIEEFLRLLVRKKALAKASGWSHQELVARSLLGGCPISAEGFDVVELELSARFAAAVTVPTGCRIELTNLVGASV